MGNLVSNPSLSDESASHPNHEPICNSDDDLERSNMESSSSSESDSEDSRQTSKSGGDEKPVDSEVNADLDPNIDGKATNFKMSGIQSDDSLRIPSPDLIDRNHQHLALTIELGSIPSTSSDTERNFDDTRFPNIDYEPISDPEDDEANSRSDSDERHENRQTSSRSIGNQDDQDNNPNPEPTSTANLNESTSTIRSFDSAWTIVKDELDSGSDMTDQLDKEPITEADRLEPKAPEPPKKRKLKAYSIETKLEVIKFAKDHGQRDTVRHFSALNISRKTVRDWLHQEQKLIECFQKGGTKRLKLQGSGRKPANPVLEERLVSWINEEKAANRSIGRKMVFMKAREIFEKMKECGELDNGGGTPKKEFAFSEGWLMRFTNRYNLVLNERFETTI